MTSKYRNVKTNGYDSKREARRAEDLKALQWAGEISDLKEQVRFELTPRMLGERPSHYVADFTYLKDGELVVEDVKSDMTRKLPVYILKRKLMLFIHGIRILET